MNFKNEKNQVIKNCAKCCQNFRINETGKTQKDVATELQVSKETVSAFETGRINNLYVFSWYMKNGIFMSYSVDEIMGSNYGD